MKTILINCTGKFCYRHDDFHKTCSQENTCAGVFFRKKKAYKFFKKDTLVDEFSC